jgi:iron complex outermembrane receptor protein
MFMKPYRHLLLSSLILAPALGSAAESTEPAAGSGALDEIIVTAQRRTERLQDVPISVSVMSQAAMDAQGTRSIDDVARLTPSVSYVRGAVNNNFESSNISIRGIDSSAGAATTGLYLDDTPIQSRHLSFGTFNAYPALFDVERVEVLRGPQGTLFGAGSEGGTLRFISPEPNLQKSSVYARAEAAGTSGGDPIYELGVAGGTPLIEDKLAFRASVSGRREGGYIDRYDWHTGTLADERANSNKTITARLAVKWAITDKLSMTPSVYYQKKEVDDISAYWSITPGAPDPTNGLFNSKFRTGNGVASPNSDKFTLAAIKVDWDLGPVTLVSNTSFFDRKQAATSDYTQFNRSIFLRTPFFDLAGGPSPTEWKDDQQNFTQEIRIQSSDATAKLNWTAGLFFQRAKENTVENVYDPDLLDFFQVPRTNPDGTPSEAFAGGYIYRQDPFSSVDKQTALFAQADYKITDKFKVMAGVRVSKTEYEGDAQYGGFVLFGPPVASSGKISEHPVTPRFGMEYRIDADNLLYVTIAKGFRIGGANPKVATTCIADLQAYGLSDVPDQYSSDSLWSYEVGSKNQFNDRRILLNASAYMIKWKNIQQNVQLNNCGFQFTANLGELKSTGFDLQGEFRLSDAFTVGGTFAYTDSKYTKTAFATPTAATTPGALSIVSDGDRLGGSPWTLALFTQLNFPLASHEAYARVDYQYGAALTDVTPNQNPANGGSPSTVFNVPANAYTSARAGVKFGSLDVSLFAQNLANTQPKLSQQLSGVPGASPLYQVYTWRPRTIGVTAIYRY